MGVGKSVLRFDAVQKVTGAAKFTEDLLPCGALIAKVLHSTIASGRVKAIDLEAARNMPGVEDIVTCFDVPGAQYATAGHPLSLDPAHGDIKDKTMLTSRVRFYGDDIAAVVADNALNAQKALEKIVVEYEETKPVFTPAEAMDGAPLHEAFPTNELARLDFSIAEGKVHWETGAFSTEKTIAGREELLSSEFYVPPVHACHIEPNNCFAYMDGRSMVVVSCNQAPYALRRNVAEAIGMPVGDVRVIKPYLGGGFGNKQDTLYEPLAAFLSRKLGGRCVAILLSREECFINSRTRHAMDIAIVSAPDGEGRLRNKAVRINANCGAYAAHGHAVAAYAVTTCFQTYTAENLQIGQSSTTYTNLPPAAALRGYGIPQIAFAMEAQMDDVAAAHGWDPIEFRRKNMMQADFVDPYDQFQVLSYGLEECIEKGKARTNWDETRAQYAAFNASSKALKKGLGMAIFSYKSGVYPLQIENAACRIVLHEDGRLHIQVGATELGQGSDTVMGQIASEILTVPEGKIHVCSTQDTDITPYDCGAYASRQAYISGAAVKKAALALKEKLLQKAADMAGLSAQGLALAQERILRTDTGEALYTIQEVARHALFINDQKTDTEHLIAEATYTVKSNCFSFGVSFADVEVDVPLGKVRVNKITAVHDSGTILNPQLSRGQLHGGIAMGVGYALGEQMLFDPQTGKPLNNNFLDYKLPTSMDIPPMETAFVETYEPTGPFGNKGLAEPPLIPQAPAIRNAILHATGVPINRLPMNPQSLVSAFIRAGLIQKV